MTPSGPNRVILLVLDSLGVGELPDAAAYGDVGSDTLGNMASRLRLDVPVLRALGLSRIARLGGELDITPRAAHGRMAEASPGKDSVTGHWELTGLVLDRAFPVFPNGFAPSLIREFERRVGRGTLGNKAASGTAIIEELGVVHQRTGRPIVYTSADSVFQIAAHEAVIPPLELYRLCEIAYELAVEGLGLGRVIARPFVGGPGHYTRTANRRDFAMPPTGETLLDRLVSRGWPVIAVGKIEDLFAGRGITRATHTRNDEHVMEEVARAMMETDRGLIFANLVDFDAQYGHRNDVAGYAANLERFDERLGALLQRLGPRDVLVITADHGNDPTTPSTDHSREFVPVLVAGVSVAGVSLGVRQTFADLGQTLAELFGVGALANGTSFLKDVLR